MKEDLVQNSTASAVGDARSSARPEREPAPEYMGTLTEARIALIRRGREWRELRQPAFGTRKELRALDRREREARFQLANAALLWLWHMEHEGLAWDGDAKLSPLAARRDEEPSEPKDPSHPLPSPAGGDKP